ncbi:hypothetical protein BCS42_02185 [Crenothrix sp. D3]|nr:hypothetical protein BCS42_02185 [Crenothrix sp. D3]
MEFTKFEKLSLKTHTELTERWVQDRIAESPAILGLGDVIVKDKERIQPRAGRLDLLLQDAELNRRYEVEIQLGATDESHIIRTIEYWDIERKRYPQYDHTAVIIAEDITSRFFNVISLFNGNIPLIAIQMSALKAGNQVGLVFTTVLGKNSLGLVDDDEEIQEVTNRAYWEARATKQTLAMADELLQIAKQFDSQLELKYNKFYIGLSKNGLPRNFIIIRPKKNFIRFEPRLKSATETTEFLENAGLNVMDYDSRNSRYRIRLNLGDIDKQKEIITQVIKKAFEEISNE